MAASSLNRLDGQLKLVVRNAVASGKTIAEHGPFNLVLMGGLFDYLSDRTARLLIRMAYTKWLKPMGTLYLSNIATGNPYRSWMEYLENWPLIERTETEIRGLFSDLANPPDEFVLNRDETGLTWLVVAKRKQWVR